MARMIPKDCPPDTESRAEVTLFNLFRDKLDKHWTIFHSFDYIDDSGKYLREGECDFILIHPNYGILCLEAKGGTVKYQDKQWYQAGKPMGKDPVEQCRKAKHYLANQFPMAIPKWDDWNIAIGHGLAFPETRGLDSDLANDLKPSMLFLQSHCEDPEKRLKEMMQAWWKQSIDLTPAQSKQIIDTLAPYFRLVPTLSASIEGLDEELVRLTEQQATVLDVLQNFPRAIIEGCAGSGKTMLAIEKARRLAAEGKQVLFLCFNKPLRNHLREQCRNIHNLFIFNFHGLCYQAVHKAEMQPPIPTGDSERAAYWAHDLPNAFMEAVEKWPYRYDALIVDEAQDFQPDWWVTIMELLKEDNGIIYLFQDSAQNIFYRDKESPIQAGVYRLSINCRNTKRIAKVAHGFGKVDATISPLAPEGIEPEFHPCADSNEWDIVRKLIYRFVEKEGLRPDQIVILGQHKFEHTPAYEKPALGNCVVVEQSATTDKPNEIRYSSIYRFKGLEADCIILLPVENNEQINDDAADALRYVAASRAKFLLHVIEG